MWAGAAVPAVDLHTASSVQTAPPLTCSETRTNTLSDLNHRSDQIQSWWMYSKWSQHPPWWCSVTMETIPLWDSIPKDHHHTDNMRKAIGNTRSEGCAVHRDIMRSSWKASVGWYSQTFISQQFCNCPELFFLIIFGSYERHTIWREHYCYKESTYKLFTPKSTVKKKSR